MVIIEGRYIGFIGVCDDIVKAVLGFGVGGEVSFGF